MSAVNRRLLLSGLAAGLGAAMLPRGLHGAGTAETIFAAAEGSAPIAGGAHPATAVWCYNGSVPGPTLRLGQGERLRVRLQNDLPAADTTIHWHGVRLPNAMDGVPHLTQEAVRPGGSFLYDFALPDAGTYWYHPHHQSNEQVARGLHGALIVTEPRPIAVDRDVVWLLGDWRLDRQAQIVPDFNNMFDASHNGRLGNTVSVNGKVTDEFAVRRGERVRLRLINAANARLFALDFEGHEVRVIALDGQPIAPRRPDGGRLVLAPAQRADIVIDMTGNPGDRASVVDRFYRGREYRLLDLVYADAPLRQRPLEADIALPPNPLPALDLAGAERHQIHFGGGMMGNLQHALVEGERRDLREMLRAGLAWSVNGVAMRGHAHAPFLICKRGSSQLLALDNDTAWHHPIHLHGHVFRVLSVDGKPQDWTEWRDTILLNPRQRAEIAFVADNPGDWMFHCHVLEHQQAGMMASLRVT